MVVPSRARAELVECLESPSRLSKLVPLAVALASTDDATANLLPEMLYVHALKRTVTTLLDFIPTELPT